ncbi:ExeM/NucH family extracellular endonuclease [Arenimonas sp.]|uniref:ExeM/NucH family extracellular endonuclease n=1 Tax=Arenimonas sp. TaxID=1872635 RepID=UPI0039E3190E
MKPILPAVFVVSLIVAGCAMSTPSRPAQEGAAKIVPIGAVQGSGPQSPMVGQRVTVEGVVVGNFARGLGGFFVQDIDGDGDDATSDGIFVALAENTPAPATSSRVRVSGIATEAGTGRDTMTTLTEPVIELLEPSVRFQSRKLTGPPAQRSEWERYEGMSFVVDAPLTITGNEGLQRFGEIAARFGGRGFQPTEIARGAEAIRKVRDDNARRALILDDGRTSENPKGLWFLPEGSGETNPLRVGATIQGIQGVVEQRRGQYRLQLTEKLKSVSLVERPPAPDVAGDLRIASLNVLNLFNGDGKGGGFPTERGAESFKQYQLQQAKLVASVQALKPDIAALMEIENDGYGPESAIAQFVDVLNAVGPIRDYRFVDAGKGPGVNPIRVAMIYRASRATPQGKPAVLEGGPFAERSRVPLAQAFRAGKGPAFVVVANHFKSKGCGRDAEAATGLDADQKDEQSCWNALRVESAKQLMAWLKTDPTKSKTDLQVLVGDFNAYAMEDPIRAFVDAGWQDALQLAREEAKSKAAARIAASPNAHLIEVDFKDEPLYSFVFNGLSGRLDHALASPAMAKRLRGGAEWHNNADESERFDYQHQGDASPYRASDHDPLLLGFDLRR